MRRYSDQIKATIRSWERKLCVKRQIMESVAKFQSRWKGLFKVFHSGAGRKQLQVESDLFDKLDKEFLDFIAKAAKKNSILDLFTDAGLRERFARLNREAEYLTQSLGPFLKGLKDDSRRLHFLSDEDFLRLFGEVL